MRSLRLTSLLSAVLWILTAVFAAVPASAQNPFEQLVMPGPLVEGHAKLEKDCANCHVPFSPKAQDGLCLKCHKPVAADIANKKGMHGIRKDATANACRHCHADHKGRTADVAPFDKQTFDHAATNFALAGKHQTATCESCHAAGKKYREASSKCGDCHKSNDIHNGQLGADCASCHTADAWNKTKPFDHKATKFPLTGAHAEVACQLCHAGERYKGVPVACASCHQKQDVHKDRNGPKCESCHKTSAWWDVAFDHDKNTKFPLLGKHQDTPCSKCHEKDPHKVKLATTCIPCHTKDDVHKEKLGKECLSCHGEASWKKDTKHDHALSRFPLRGKHADAKCDACHKTKLYKDTPIACAACHAKKDAHEGRLGPGCGQCHNVTEWKHTRFDHNDTKFRLTGRHAKATCYSCHSVRHVDKATLPTDCYACHKSQDRHRGAFGRNCGKCHTTATFGTAYIRN